MLVISRRVGERVRVRVPTPAGPVDVWIEAIERISGLRQESRSRVRIGIEAPQQVSILREELIESREPKQEQQP